MAQRHNGFHSYTRGLIYIIASRYRILEIPTHLSRSGGSHADTCRFISWWIALGVIPTLVAARYFAKRSNSFYILISALMLSLEMSGNNFGGVVTRLPTLRETADAKLREYLEASRTRFLDLYLPRRDKIPAHALTELEAVLELLDITPDIFKQIYLSEPGNSWGPEAKEVVDLLAAAGLGVGLYHHPHPPIFWQKAAAAANELGMWLKRNPTATPEERAAAARRVVNRNRLVHRSLRSA
jgi:hypothetical protein